MILVTGTKRSGTSMWMQLMKAAGLAVIGEEFPRNWRDRIYDANPEGFYESPLRQGINFSTNPNPQTGEYLAPRDTRANAVKVFIPGLARTDLAYIDRVVATIRPWRQYVASLNRLYALEAEARLREATDAHIPPPTYVRPELEWWSDNFTLLGDVVLRGYPIYMVAYDSVLQDPQRTLTDVFDWLEHGDADAAIAQVKPQLRTQADTVGDGPADLDADAVAAFDAIYAMARNREPLTQQLVDWLNDTQERLEPIITADRRRVAAARSKRARAIRMARRVRKSAVVGAPDPSRKTPN